MIGALAVSLVQLAPHAALALTIALVLFYKVGALPLMAGGAAIGLLTRGKAWGLIVGLVTSAAVNSGHHSKHPDKTRR